jgi:H+/Cl- antiporter ClcA
MVRYLVVEVPQLCADQLIDHLQHNREGLSIKQTWAAVTNKYLWPFYVIGVLFGLAGYPLTQYFQISMRQLGFSTLEANLLSIPNQAATIFIVSAREGDRPWGVVN